MGADRKCYVLGGDGVPQLRDIVCGMSNERLVEVKSGLKEGEKVVLDPRPLLPEGSDLKAAKPRTKGQEGGGEGGEQKNWKKGEGQKGPGGAIPGKGPGPGGPGGLKGGPGGPKGGPGATPGAGGAPDAAAMQRMQEQFMTQMRSLTPEQRRDRLNQIPAEWRDKARQAVQGAGLQVAN
jgi:hypothetical protein